MRIRASQRVLRARISVAGLTLLTACSSTPTIQGLKTYSYPSGQHQPNLITYKESPSVGGPHNPTWQNCGVYPAPLFQMYVTHSLEHGAVSITYRPGLPDVQRQVLRDVARTHSYVLLSPFDNQQAPIVLSAWGAQLGVEDASDSRVQAFLQRYEQAKSSPEPGAPCQGGVSSTT
ncbi:DUF3105 domain-containing protein [Deinococcus ruber]|uniref:DUF3105 domain-containing protein n=1 Tax=Deinococcus ruber TaxID=1848197 RepID=A0A918CGL2_9DEIO|nr:DUF3105 domain-containing protein [Deinococcus ruber]GGR20975.1 hypothetical protein GCM10008957_36550 [Deinococcus ruber]